MTKIAVILCYFGKLPENFSLFAESCRRNATIDFLLFTDDTPTHLPENMHLHPTTFAALQRRVAVCCKRNAPPLCSAQAANTPASSSRSPCARATTCTAA